MKKDQICTLLLSLLTMAALCFAQAEKQTEGTRPAAGHPVRSKSAASSKKTDDEKIIDLEKQGWEAIKNKDWNAFGSLLSEDFVNVDDDGITTGRSEVVKLTSNLNLTDYSLEESKVVMLSKDVALLTYKATEKGSSKGQDLPSKPFYMSSAYVKRGGKWVNVFFQETLAK